MRTAAEPIIIAPTGSDSVKIVLLSSRFPWPAFSGDRTRATIWIDALAHEHDVTLIAPGGEVPPGAPPFRFRAVGRSARRAFAGALRVLAGAPVQTMPAAAYDWPRALEQARHEVGGFDAAIVLLSRLDLCVRAHLPQGLHILDAIDSLRRSMEERARNAGPLLRWFWRAEERRMKKLEGDAVRASDEVLVVSQGEEAEELRARAISNGVVIRPLGDAPRTFDFAFWGRLAYFANADAAAWLLAEIWPRIRRAAPGATLLIAGAEAPRRIRAAHGRDGIVVESPAADIAARARQVKVALFPVRYGTGQMTKVLEAAEGGCAIVATRKALRGLDALTTHALVADDASTLARCAVEALADGARRAALARNLRSAVEAAYSRRATIEQLAAVVTAGRAAA